MRVVFWMAGMLVLMNLTACNTMKGFGEDMQQAGASIQQEADKKSSQ